MREGKEQGQISIKTAKGVVLCAVFEDTDNIYFEMPSGKEDRVAKKASFLAEISAMQPCN